LKEEPVMQADGFDKAVIGITDGFGGQLNLVYDIEKCLKILMSRDGMDREEALEFFTFNVSGAYVGKGTPIFMWKMTLKEMEDADVIQQTTNH
jgi:hypothetical protein|tara:strand:+ start:788 stop:1066 length:279 start_codon:yes stop_codon:yes gene_type:complete